MNKETARKAVSQFVVSEEFERFIKGSDPGVVPVAVLDQELMDFLGAKVHTAGYSAYDRDLHRPKAHLEGRDRFPEVQRMIDTGTIVRYRDLAVSIFEMDGKLYTAVLKRTADGKEVYMRTVHRVNDRKLTKALEEGIKLRGDLK